jgi:hypothetical protein
MREAAVVAAIARIIGVVIVTALLAGAGTGMVVGYVIRANVMIKQARRK